MNNTAEFIPWSTFILIFIRVSFKNSNVRTNLFHNAYKLMPQEFVLFVAFWKGHSLQLVDISTEQVFEKSILPRHAKALKLW